jgi:hypothetical protein
VLKGKARSLLLAVLLAFVVSVMGIGAAFAGTSDPFMTSYELGSRGYIYTYDDLRWTGNSPRVVTAELYTGPSADGVTPSYFNTSADAEAVEWSFIDDGSVYVVEFTNTMALNDGNGWLAYAEVNIYDCVRPTQFGAVSIQALNPNATDPYTEEKAYVNFTIQINEEDQKYTRAVHIGYQVWDPAGGPPNPLQGYATTETNDFHETGRRTYPTVMDGVVRMLMNGWIGLYVPVYNPGLGDTVQSLTVNGRSYENNEKIGWQYRVYRQVGQFYTMLPMSSVVGPDAFKLIDDDIVVWKYDNYHNLNLFPATIKSWP